MNKDLKDLRAPFEEMAEMKLSGLSVPRLSTTVAILQDYSDPESFLLVDFALCLALQKLDRQSFEVARLVDGKRSIQEITGKINGPNKTAIQQRTLGFFEFLRSIRAIDL